MQRSNSYIPDLPDQFFQDIKLLATADIKSLISMEEAITAVEQAFASYSDGTSHVPQRYVSSVPGISMDLFFKPAYNEMLGRIAVKILTQKKAGTKKGIPSILGVVLLIDTETGAILSMIDGTYLTALRTGAASGIATRLLAKKDAETVAIFGCGAQGKTQLEAICSVSPVKHALLYDINIDSAMELKTNMEEKMNISIDVEQNLQNLKQADIICTATNSDLPLFSRDDISVGVHINAIGSYKPNMQEIDPQIIKSSILFADSKEAVLKESGDLIKPINDRIFSDDIIRSEIGDLINHKVMGRQKDDEISIFKSVGLGVQDLFVANAIYNKHVEG
ncbi:MAG: ornithine cyclodeaminase [Bacteroidota bacterium]|nr:ornithine cyclodeaminase [Bacteroidota bacterium]